MTEDEMVGWHHQLNGHEFEQAPGVGDGQGGPAWDFILFIYFFVPKSLQMVTAAMKLNLSCSLEEKL